MTTMNNLFNLAQQYFFILFFIHILLSIVLSFIISKYALKRFKKSGAEIVAKDKQRLLYMHTQKWFSQLLLKISLYQNNQIAIFLFTITLNIALPFIGYFVTVWLFWYMVNIKYDKKVLDTNTLNLDEFKSSFLKVERSFGEGSMINLIGNAYIPKSKKIRALSMLATNSSPLSLSIVKQTLTSDDDEIRMFGYAILNKTEKALNEKINFNLDILRLESLKGENKNHQKVALAAKELAFLYWEMIYTELSHESLKTNFLNSSILYLMMAKDYYLSDINHIIQNMNKLKKDDPQLKIERNKLEETYLTCSNLFTLMGRVYSKKEKYDKAKESFTMAEELLFEKSTAILPYLAEVYFITKKYSITKSILKHAKELQLTPKLYPIIKQWEVVS